MGDPKGFIKVGRKEAGNRPVHERIYDYGEVEQTLNLEDRKLQASRCMDCGVPYCHWACPVENIIPEWNDAIYAGDWKKAIELMHSTNNFPEFTGRICPAPCEHACVLAIGKESVTIRENEAAIAEYAFNEGYIKPEPPLIRTGKHIAVIGSGPAGLACADLLNKFGHHVTVFEKDDAAGGLLRFGIPDFKLSKVVVDRRLNILVEEGINIKTSCHAGVDISSEELLSSFDAICIAVGSREPRNLPAEGRDLRGICFAMDFLTQQNKIVRGDNYTDHERITAKDKKVLVIGGGDTGSDCIGTSIRQGARSIMQIEILPKPPEFRDTSNPWPYFSNTLKTSSSQSEGCERRWCLSTIKFHGASNHVTHAEMVQVEWTRKAFSKPEMKVIPGSNEMIETDLVLLAMGFVHPVKDTLLAALGIDLTGRDNIRINRNHQTSIPKIFAAGDAIMGASLVVRAIFSGRQAAFNINNYLGTLV
jgi:glutamate synthase (NADPH/NADH) small chain